MRKLLSANFSRLRKDRIFWSILLGVLVFSLVTIFNGARSADVMEKNGFVRSLDDYYFSQAPYMGMIYAVFISLFLGTEYSDGTMRNKLIIGHTRARVFLANFITCFAACLAFAGAWFIGCAPGWILIGPFEMGIEGYLTYLLIAVGFTASYTAIFTWFCTVCSNKAMTIILTLGAWFGLVLLASALNDRLCVPEMQGGMAYIDGKFTMLDPAPNPLYLKGMIRTVCECILDFLPSGQTLLMHDASITHPLRQIASSVLTTDLLLPAGIISFRRKDIR